MREATSPRFGLKHAGAPPSTLFLIYHGPAYRARGLQRIDVMGWLDIEVRRSSSYLRTTQPRYALQTLPQNTSHASLPAATPR